MHTTNSWQKLPKCLPEQTKLRGNNYRRTKEVRSQIEKNDSNPLEGSFGEKKIIKSIVK